MSLQFVFGPSGGGKSYYLYEKIIEEAKRPDQGLFTDRTGTVHDADAKRTGRTQ